MSASEVAVRAEALVKTFGSTRALDGVDLEIPTGTVLGLLGPNGAGKTTTVRILTTLLKPDSGRATVAGHDVLHDPQAVRRAIGLSGQYAAVDENLTGYENLWMVARLYGMNRGDSAARARELLARFRLDEAADRPAKGYSGGMRRRLDLIASLLRAPRVLFLDEPTTGLDVRGRMEIWDTVRELVAEGTTVLLTSQYLEEVDQLASAVGVIDRGQLVAEGSPAQLKSQIGSHIDIVVESADHLARAMEVMERMAGNRPEADGLHIVVAALDPVPTLPQIVRELDASGAVIRDVGIREPSLDDVFLSLTGKPAEPRESPEAIEVTA